MHLHRMLASAKWPIPCPDAVARSCGTSIIRGEDDECVVEHALGVQCIGYIAQAFVDGRQHPRKCSALVVCDGVLVGIAVRGGYLGRGMDTLCPGQVGSADGGYCNSKSRGWRRDSRPMRGVVQRGTTRAAAYSRKAKYRKRGAPVGSCLRMTWTASSAKSRCQRAAGRPRTGPAADRPPLSRTQVSRCGCEAVAREEHKKG